MNVRQAPSASPDHPAPGRHATSRLALWFGILAAPLAWSAEELFSYGVASRLCGMKSAHTAASLATATSPWFLVTLAVTFLIALAGLGVALRTWRRTRLEQRGPGHHPLQPGEAGIRFMATWGLIASIGFVIAFFFTGAYMVVAPVCGK